MSFPVTDIKLFLETSRRPPAMAPERPCGGILPAPLFPLAPGAPEPPATRAKMGRLGHKSDFLHVIFSYFFTYHTSVYDLCLYIYNISPNPLKSSTD